MTGNKTALDRASQRGKNKYIRVFWYLSDKESGEPHPFSGGDKEWTYGSR